MVIRQGVAGQGLRLGVTGKMVVRWNSHQGCRVFFHGVDPDRSMV
jgi:hypothetical protein